MLYQNSFKGNDESALLKTGLPRAVSRLSIVFSLNSYYSLVKTEKSSKDRKQTKHKMCPWISISLLLSIFTCFPVRYEMSKYSHIWTLKWRLEIDFKTDFKTAATILIFVNNF